MVAFHLTGKAFPRSQAPAWERTLAKLRFATRSQRTRLQTRPIVAMWKQVARRFARCQGEPGNKCVPKPELGNEGGRQDAAATEGVYLMIQSFGALNPSRPAS